MMLKNIGLQLGPEKISENDLDLFNFFDIMGADDHAHL